MFAKLRSWLRGSSRSQPCADAQERSLERLRRLRAEALARVRDAEQRRDDRDLGRARMQLQEATTAELMGAVWK